MGRAWPRCIATRLGKHRLQETRYRHGQCRQPDAGEEGGVEGGEAAEGPRPLGQLARGLGGRGGVGGAHKQVTGVARACEGDGEWGAYVKVAAARTGARLRQEREMCPI